MQTLLTIPSRLPLALALVMYAGCSWTSLGSKSNQSLAQESKGQILEFTKLHSIERDDDSVGTYRLDLGVLDDPSHPAWLSQVIQSARGRITISSNVKPESCYTGTGRMLARAEQLSSAGNRCIVACRELISSGPAAFRCPGLLLHCER